MYINCNEKQQQQQVYKDVYEVMMSAPKGHESLETDFITF